MTRMYGWMMLGVLVLMLGVPVSAAPVTVTASGATRLIDGNGDDVGDSTGNSTTSAAAIGEPGNKNENNEGRMLIYFNPSAAERDEIAAASQVIFNVILERTGDNAANLAGYEVDMYGYEDVTFTGVAASQYHQAATLLQSGVFTPADAHTVSSDVWHSFDVTAFAKTEAARSATSTIAFRFQVDPDAQPIADGNQVFWVGIGIDGSRTATLSVIPEPASAAMLGLGALALMRRRHG